ncbi:MAG: preprotein translocase subunit YajC [Magnetococcales bacterium]|nr:preprotein translocase subunit YajC [Magnetococcales bacterium]MBF0113627.1 preprotein translocase subunit YajC [Magnetococcales bacterium]
MLDLISTAYAAAPSNTEAVIGNIVFMVALFGIFYFFLIRPQQKQAKAHKEMVANLTRGDTVVTGGGLIGRVHRVENDLIILEVGDVEIGNKLFRPVRIRVRRVSVVEVTSKGTFSPENKTSATEDSQG